MVHVCLKKENIICTNVLYFKCTSISFDITQIENCIEILFHKNAHIIQKQFWINLNHNVSLKINEEPPYKRNGGFFLNIFMYRNKLYFTECGGYYTDVTGTLTSPNYPSNYPDNVDCYYYITVSTGYIIQLTVDDFCTEACCDFLKVCFNFFQQKWKKSDTIIWHVHLY